MEKYDIGLAYVWEYDKDFIDAIEQTLQPLGISTYIISEHNVHETTELIKSKKLGFDFYLDRGWDVDEDFESLGKIIAKKKTYIFNPYHQVLHAIDKATMHLEFITAGIHTPYSLIIPPKSVSDEIFLSLSDLAILGRPFIIKPCNTTGGGMGVVTGAESLEEILSERHRHGEDKYLLQEKVYPADLEGRRAWFRCFWAFGRSIPCWWDDQTHLYNILHEYEIEDYGLSRLHSLTKKIAVLTGLDFFSTELVYSSKNEFVAIDYVNDQCDMRLQSKHYDGVPDAIAMEIIRNMYRSMLRIRRKQQVV